MLVGRRRAPKRRGRRWAAEGVDSEGMDAGDERDRVTLTGRAEGTDGSPNQNLHIYALIRACRHGLLCFTSVRILGLLLRANR